MTPGARLAAAIEILDTILVRKRPADLALTEWARAHRFAGSGDRRGIEARVYHVLRRRNECAALAAGHDEPRALVLGSLRLEGLDVDSVSRVCTDGPHAPGALSSAEIAMISAPIDGGDAPWVRLNTPEWLHAELSRSLGSNLEGELEAMLGRAPLDVRVNSLKTDRKSAQDTLARHGIAADISELAPDALRLREPVQLEPLDIYRDGWIEVQDIGSQAVCELLDAKPGERIVDLCAGAGGKSLALAAKMRNQGTILACDVDGKRLGRLAPRAVRCGATAIELTGDPYSDHPHLSAGSADAVLVDAPCSGSGTWRRNPEAKWSLHQARLDGYRAAQAQALDRAAALVRPGGRVLYVTCSLLRCEGEDQAESFLGRTPSLRLARQVRFSPASTGTDGFFAALFQSVAA
jgi:16S rRNA (cytosine967-C5)-methyltransferase